MTPTARTLAARLRADERLIGALVRMPCEEIVEMLAVAGVDFVLVDCEHGPADLIALRTHIALAQVHGTPVLVRPGEAEPALMLRALDQGAQGIVAPHVESAREAQRLVSAVHYPPTGTRGFATYSRAGRFGTVTPTEHRSATTETTVVFAMLESPHAASRAAEILSTPGLDGYLIGTADLRATTGPGDPSVQSSIERVHRDAASVNLRRCDIVGSRADAERAFEAGAQVVIYNTVQALMGLFDELVAAKPDDSHR